MSISVSLTSSDKRFSLSLQRNSFDLSFTEVRLSPSFARAVVLTGGSVPGSERVTVDLEAGEALGGHRAVTVDANGKAIYASNLTAAHLYKVVGITLNAAILAGTVIVLKDGAVEETSWSWTVGSPVFLGSNGLLTQTLPTAPAFLQILGVPLSPTRLLVSIREPIVLS